MSEELTWLPAWRIRDLIGKREVSCVEVTEHFLGRIEEFNPVLRAFEQVDHAGAREQARRADRAVAGGEPLGPLHGIPTSVKSHIRVEGLHYVQPGTDVVSTFDDICVERLRRAGAIIIGTNTMMGAGADLTLARDRPGVFSPFNWDAEALSPWDTTRVPGWSSSGGAATAAARLLPVTIGSDGGGSTRLPAAYSGVVGLHTSRGLIPHVNYDKPTMLLTASYGPLARYVRDAALFTRAMSGGDGRDYVSLQDDTPDPVEALDRGVEGMSMAWTEDFGFAATYATADSARIIDVARAAAQSLTTLGATVDPTEEVWEDRAERGTVRWTVEPSVYEVMVGTNSAPLPALDPVLYREQAQSRARNWEHFQRLFRRYDVILSVTAQRIAAPVEEWERAWTVDGPTFPGGSFAPVYCSHTMIFNWLGFPAVTVPCGFVDGLPVGLQIAAWHGREDLVLRVAAAFQQAFPRDEHPVVS
ncbi:amidase [Frankia tisae]|uniref:amidase n=1 Tax=Frankia tisae TaxID=2950104 RepID=UPI0021BF10F9|nr:amidase [Frankia tisae]